MKADIIPKYEPPLVNGFARELLVLDLINRLLSRVYDIEVAVKELQEAVKVPVVQR